MKRNICLTDISDGKLYDSNDMVKLDCNDCQGCSACCRGMGHTIILDPYDIYQLTMHFNSTFQQLLQMQIELNLFDGIILPNLKMTEEEDCCSFLTNEGRCSIHSYRPGLCRLFPLGRYYENNTFQYFLQVHECQKTNRTKMKVSRWVGITNIKEYENFINVWHDFINLMQEQFMFHADDLTRKSLNVLILNTFFLTPYQTDLSFYSQFQTRMKDIQLKISTN